MLLLASLFGFLFFVQAHPIHSEDNVIQGIGVPCSTDTSSAWIDLIFVIDVSSNMGSSNLQKIKSSLSLILSKYPIGQDKLENTRIALVTYASSATIVADLTAFNSFSDFTSKLNSISIKSDSHKRLDLGINSAWTIVQEQIASSYNGKPIGVILLAAGVDPNYLNQISQVASSILGYSSIVGVNYNPSDLTLGNVLNAISSNNMVYYGSSNTLVSDLNWAFTQSNCYCPRNYGTIFSAYDPSMNKVTRFAECYIILNWDSFPPNMNSLTMCSPGYQVSLLTKAKSDFVQNRVGLAQFGVDQAYISLHQNTAQNWVWFDYDGSELPLNFTNWESGSPSSSSNNCAILDKSSGGTYPWKSVPCFPSQTGVTHTICAKLACDATRRDCITGGGYKKVVEKEGHKMVSV